MHYSSITILYNPNSTGDSKANALNLKKELQDREINEVQLVATEYPGHAEELAYEISKSAKKPLIVSSSGDGGYNEVINGALRAKSEGADPVTCVLPSGNANDHFNQLHAGDTAGHIAEGRIRYVDILRMTAEADKYSWHRYAHSYIGFGVTPEIGRELNKAKLNKTNEVIISLRAFLKSKPFSVIEDDKEEEYQSIVVSNLAKMSKVLGLAKTSEVDDGLFEVFALPPSKPFAVGVFVKSATVGLRYTKQTDNYSFKTTGNQVVQCDGEIFDIRAHANIRIRNEQKTLACIV